MSLTVRQKLILNAAFAITAALVVGISGFVGFQQVGGAMDRIVENSRALRHQMRSDMLHHTLRSDVYGALFEGGQTGGTQNRKIAAETRRHGDELIKALDDALSLAPPDVKPLIEETRAPLQRYVAESRELSRLAFEDYPQAVGRLAQFLAVFHELEATMEKAADRIEGHTAQAQAAGGRAVEYAMVGMVAVCVLAPIALSLLSFLIARGILVPLDRAVEASGAVAAGDLSVRIQAGGRDEIGRLLDALEKMRGDLGGALHRIRAAARNVNTGSREIARGNADLSSRTEEQASSLQETASSMTQITAAVRQNTDNARQASALADGASDLATRGGHAVRGVVATMAGISDASRRIADITAVIDGIAFQTNILALNAAVEAARAGAEGRGFAVVASEVRALAQRSAAAAGEIKQLIEDAAGRVSEGARQVDGAGQTMEEIVAAVQRVSGIVSQIAEASAEQFRGVEQVGRAVAQMDHVVQQNAALVEQSAAAAENLASQAEQMAATIEGFKLEAETGPAAASPGEPLRLARARHPARYRRNPAVDDA